MKPIMKLDGEYIICVCVRLFDGTSIFSKLCVHVI